MRAANPAVGSDYGGFVPKRSESLSWLFPFGEPVAELFLALSEDFGHVTRQPSEIQQRHDAATMSEVS
jgi:hypothetical protein